MYCTQCGQQQREGQAFCSHCGKAVGAAPSSPRPSGRLVRIKSGKKIAGVCAGFARYTEVDVTVVRIAWLLTALTCGVGFIAYIVAWIAMPVEDAPLYAPASMA
jgi:phage shock protein C